MLAHVIITLLSCVTHVTSEFQCRGTCYSGSFPQNNQVIKGKYLRGYSYKNITTDVPRTCFSSCINDCRCNAFQLNDVKCELLDEDKTSKAADFVDETGYVYYDLQQTFYKGNPSSSVISNDCSNGCCQNQPCLNGGTCKEKCQHPRTKFNCKCTTQYHGRVCEKKVASCWDILKSAPEGPMPDKGVYNITLTNTNITVPVYCLFDQKLAWTLIESFSIKNLHLYVEKAFHQNASRNVDSPDKWKDYRLSLYMMKYIRSKAVMFRATCDYPNRPSNHLLIDSLLGYLSDYDLINGGDVEGKCFKFAYINIRGQEFFNITTGVWHKLNTHQIHLDCHAAPCGNLKLNDSVAEDDCFGKYNPIRREMSKCTATEESTTQWWLGEQQ